MKQLEIMQMNAVPSLQTIYHEGWVLRFANGFFNRANSVYAMEHDTEDIEQKIHFCETAYWRQGLRPAFRICPASEPAELDSLLAARGYQVIHKTRVMTLPLIGSQSVPDSRVQVKDSLDSTWLRHFCRLSAINRRNQSTYGKMLANILTPTLYATLTEDSQVVACCMAVLENRHSGIFDLIVDPEYRRRGLGCQLLTGILNACGNKDARTAYLQVAADNKAAVRLYGKLGFNEIYEYHYRVLDP